MNRFAGLMMLVVAACSTHLNDEVNDAAAVDLASSPDVVEDAAADDGPPATDAQPPVAEAGADQQVSQDGGPGDGGFDPLHRVGMLYFVHHAPPTAAAQATSSTLTVEQVIRGDAPFSSIYGGAPAHPRALGHLYHHQPEIGFYCLFEPISDPTLPPAAVNHANSWSCNSNVSAVAKTHAEQMVDAGVDFVVLDLSNPTEVETTIAGAGPLLMALRPTEILFREWAKLRQQGITTPQIAAWAPVPAGATLWQRYLALYNKYPGLALTHQRPGALQGKMVFFYVDSYDSRKADAALLAAIADNGGKGNVVTVPMWTHLNQDGSFGSSTRWAFMSPCRRKGQRTTSIIGAGHACDQPDTPQSVVGSQITVGPSYQYEGGYASLPFQAPGKLRGLTLKKQFHTAWKTKRAYLLITGWNEHSSGHWQPAFTQPDVFAVGLESDLAYGKKQFIDAYGAEYSRDLEPTLEYGRRYYDLLRSCVQRYKTGTCVAMGGENCCNLTDPYVNVFSLLETPHPGYDKRAKVAVDASEVQSSLSGTWRQICNRFPGTADFCVNGNEPNYQAGPFIAFAAAAPGRTGIYRCYNSANNKHFLTVTPAVECASPISGGGTPLFHISDSKNSETPRVLRRCYDKTHGSHFHAVGLPCPAGTEDAPAFGFVR